MKRKKLQDVSGTVVDGVDNTEGINEVCMEDAAPIDTYDESDDTDDTEEEIEFFKALQEMEGKDITQLKEMLMQEGEDIAET